MKNYIYKGISQTANQNIVYGYLVPSNLTNTCELVELSQCVTTYHRVYMDSVELFWTGGSIDKPIYIYELLKLLDMN